MGFLRKSVPIRCLDFLGKRKICFKASWVWAEFVTQSYMCPLNRTLRNEGAVWQRSPKVPSLQDPLRTAPCTVVADMNTELIRFEPETCICNGHWLKLNREDQICNETFFADNPTDLSLQWKHILLAARFCICNWKKKRFFLEQVSVCNQCGYYGKWEIHIYIYMHAVEFFFFSGPRLFLFFMVINWAAFAFFVTLFVKTL